jgi:tRNA (Thr-GGU) A37 N-methylase
MISYEPIGKIHAPFRTPRDTPLQLGTAEGARGRIELEPEHEEALNRVAGTAAGAIVVILVGRL